MPIKLETVDVALSLSDLESTIRSIEKVGFQTITLAHGVVTGLPSNTVTLRGLPLGTQPKPISLRDVSGALAIGAQETKLNNDAPAGKELISYAAVWVNGVLTNVAVYR